MSEKTRGNAIRTAIKNAAESGNRRMIREEDFVEAGGTFGDFADYDRIMTTIEDLGREWCKLKFNENDGQHDERISEIESVIIDHEKTIFKWLRTEETKAFFHASPGDGAYIASLTDSFMAVKNNVGNEQGFTAPKSHAPVKHSVFRKALENHFGTKVLALGTISPEHAEYLREERKILSAVKRAKKQKEEQETILAGYKKELAKATSEDVKGFIEGKIKAVNKLLDDADNAITKAERKLVKLQQDYPDELMHEDTLVEIREAAKKAKEEREARKNAKEQDKQAELLAASRKLAVSRLSKDQMIAEIVAAGIEVPEKADKKTLKPLVKQAREAVAA